MRVYGESHFTKGEVDRIRNSIVKYNPHVILHEFPDDERTYYGEAIPNTHLLPLETATWPESVSLARQFAIRENSMITNIRKVFDFQRYGRVAIVVGDTHLRTITTKELGPPILYAYLNSLPNVAVFRSQHREIE